LKIGTLVTPALGRVYTNVAFLRLSASFEFKARTVQTDGRTGKTGNAAYQTAAWQRTYALL